MEKPAYFVSDIHLGAPSLTAEFELTRRSEILRFLNEVMTNGSRLIIVGDLFDFWYEYNSVIPKEYFWLYAKFKEMIEKGVTIDYVAGNHDFFLGTFFSDSLGLKVYQDGFSEKFDGKKMLVIHGDGLAEKDSGYRMLKKILRNGLVRWAIRWIHPDLGFPLARAFSKKSREYTSTKDYGESDGMTDYARGKIEDGYEYVVMGHNHSPKLQKFEKGVYVNLGDWLRHFTYAVFDGHELRLFKWKFENEPKSSS